MIDGEKMIEETCEYCIYNANMRCRRIKDKLPEKKCLHYVSRFQRKSLKKLIEDTADILFGEK